MKALATTFAAFMTAAAFADGASGSLTVGCPTANIDEFRRLSHTRFHQDSFIEQLDFDYLEIRVIEE